MTKPLAVILGRGVLGNALAAKIPAWWDAYQVSRRDGIDIADPERIRSLLRTVTPSLIINAAGVIDPEAQSADIIRTNSVAPAVLAVTAPCPVIQVSTDCVFQPMTGKRRTSYMPPDVERGDLYGTSKAAGEFPLLQLVVRTSFVGEGSRMWSAMRRAATSDHIYLGWETLWAGGHVEDVAQVIVDKVIPEAMGGRKGIIHVARPEPISKFDIAKLTAQHLGLELDIFRIHGPEDRILVPTAGFELGPYLMETS